MGVDDLRQEFNIPLKNVRHFGIVSISMSSLIREALFDRLRDIPVENGQKQLPKKQVNGIFKEVSGKLHSHIEGNPVDDNGVKIKPVTINKAKEIADKLGPEGQEALFDELFPREANNLFCTLSDEPKAPEL